MYSESMSSRKTISKSDNFLKSKSAVTEVMDFISIVGILLLAFSIIGVAGYPVLRNAQETRYIENTRLSFIVLADNINRITLGQAPSQSVEMKIYGGRLSSTGESRINITAVNSTGYRLTFDQQMRSIENSIGDTIVAYEGTAVWVKYPNGVVLNAYKPVITNQSNVLVIPVVFINGNSSVGGTGMSRVTAKGIPGITYWDNVSDIMVRINSSYSDAWRDYYNSTMLWDNCPVTSNCTVRLNRSNMDIYILKTQIDTEIV